MCGFLGKISVKKLNTYNLSDSCSYINCRGPDSNVNKNFSNDGINFFLSFHRLKILDLNDLANQPMYSDKYKTYCMFNGEIYNHKFLRKELEAKGVKFKTSHSDSEVVLNGISHEGINFIHKLRGQFSIFFLDLIKNKAYLISDRVSQKPLYYCIENNSLIFSSNLKSILKSMETYDINTKNLEEYLAYGVVSSPNTLFENIYKLNPASTVEISFNKNKFDIKKNTYWDPYNFIDNNELNEDIFFEILNEAVSLRSKADVEVANFSSGGIDSTSVIKSMADNNFQINTFSVHLDDTRYDERYWSDQVSEKYNTNHNFVEISANINSSKINESIESLDEPYSDPSVVPSYLLSKEISKKFKVAISGDGGDELLGGYKRVSRTLNTSSNLLRNLYSFYPSFLGTGNEFLKSSKDKNLAYSSYFKDDKFIKLLGLKSEEILNVINLDTDIDLYKAILIQDYKYYLPDMMMLKVDRTSMANSLEVRSPFVDHKLIEYVMSLNPNNEKLKSKKILKQYLQNDFSKEFVYRDKKGFIFNLEGWIFSNFNEVSQTIKTLENFGLDLKKINLLKINKSRMNANRIWRLYVLSKYLLGIKYI